VIHVTPLTGYSILGGAVTLIIALVLTGGLITRRMHDKVTGLMQAQIDNLVRDRDSWRDIALGTTGTTKLLAQVGGAFVEVGQTAAQVIAAMPPVNAVMQANSAQAPAAPHPHETPHVAT
jgi:hypothetical protein